MKAVRTISALDTIRIVRAEGKIQLKIRGVADAAVKAQQLIEKLTTNDISAIGMREEVRTINHEIRGQIIGKGGNSIRALRNGTGAFIKIMDEDFMGKTEVIIIGRAEAVQNAIKQLGARLAQEFKKQIMSVCVPGFMAINILCTLKLVICMS